MSARFTFDGIQELIRTLRTVPQDLANEKLGPIIKASAESMAAELKSAYPKVTGTLADRVVVERPDQRGGLLARVRSKAPHAHLYEYGSVRRFTNDTGAARGSMPAKATFVPAAVRARQRMFFAIKGALVALRVPGLKGSFGARET